MSPRSIDLAGAFALMTASLPAQQEAWQIEVITRSEGFGAAMAPLSDFDGDGVRDLLVCAPGMESLSTDVALRVVSGATLATLLEVWHDSGTYSGTAVASAGDFDGDGLDDLLLGDPSQDKAYLFSSHDGALLREWGPTVPNASYGSTIAGLGDVNGDGALDFAIGGSDSDRSSGAGGEGRVEVRSGLDGSLLWHVVGSNKLASMGDFGGMASTNDVDGDGVMDLALIDVAATGVYGVRHFSGASGSEIWNCPFNAGRRIGYWPTGIRAIGDFDGDGVDDLAVGAFPARAFVLSGTDGSELWLADPPVGGLHAAVHQVDSVGDRDGDGRPEIAVYELDFTASVFQPIVTLHRGSDAAQLGRIDGPPDSYLGSALVGGIDVDGDGLGDVTLGDPTTWDADVQLGTVAHYAWPAGNLVASRTGEGDSFRAEGIAAIGDVDGDGTNDWIAANQAWNTRRFSVRLFSGRDGATLADRNLSTSPGGIVALPDLDGDGLADYGVRSGTSSSNARVVLASTVDGHVLRTLTTPGWDGEFGKVVAVGVQPSGAVHVAIAAPQSNAGAIKGGAVACFDAATGATVFQKLGTWYQEELGTSIAFLGDVNGDGTGDWAFGAPHYGPPGQVTGRVVVVSGTNGATITKLLGVNDGDEFGHRVAALGDADGDLVPDLAVASPFSDPGSNGDVTAFSGAAWTSIWSVTGASSRPELGSELAAFRDVNGDGIADWAAQCDVVATSGARIVVRSGASGSLLARFDIPSRVDRYGIAAPASWQPGSASGDAIADLLLMSKNSIFALKALDDVMLQVVPSSAPAGATVVADLRGGPAGNACLFLLAEMNGTPVGAVIELTTLDALGAAAISDVVPPGLAGTSFVLIGYGIGFDGRVKDSTPQTLIFE